MDIQKTIIINIERKGNNFVCKDLNTACLILGTKSLSGNLKYYGVSKSDNNYIIPYSKVVERIKILKHRRGHLCDTIDIMEQVIR